jgi:hypothetical protein
MRVKDEAVGLAGSGRRTLEHGVCALRDVRHYQLLARKVRPVDDLVRPRWDGYQ